MIESDGKTYDHYNTEFFAENFDFHVRNKDLTNTRKIFDDSCDLFDELLEEILKEKL